MGKPTRHGFIFGSGVFVGGLFILAIDAWRIKGIAFGMLGLTTFLLTAVALLVFVVKLPCHNDSKDN